MALRFHVDGDLPHRLDRVGMEENVPLPRQGGRLFDGEDHPGLVVGPHEAHQRPCRG